MHTEHEVYTMCLLVSKERAQPLQIHVALHANVVQ